jgi:hypothetical protein
LLAYFSHVERRLTYFTRHPAGVFHDKGVMVMKSTFLETSFAYIEIRAFLTNPVTAWITLFVAVTTERGRLLLI